MKRHLIVAAACLLVGAVANVLVAWGCSYWRSNSTAVVVPPSEAAAAGWLWPEVGWPPPTQRLVYPGFGLRATSVSDAVETSPGVPGVSRAVTSVNHSMSRVEAGWPLLSVSAEESLSSLGPIPPGRGLTFLSMRRGIRGVVTMPGGAVRGVWLPVSPMSVGFAADAVLYGGLFWVALVGPFAVRRARRRRRGRCVNCGYDLAGIAGPCPECGWGRA